MLAPLPEPFQYLLEDSQHASFIYNVSMGRMLYLSAAYERLFPGHPRANVDADLPRLLSYLPAEDQTYARKCFAELAAGQLHDELLLRVQPRPDVPRRWLCVRAHRSATPDGQTLLSGTVNDVTVEQEYIRNADKYMAKKNTTLEILSHDLAGPFNMLQQLAEYIGEKTRPLNDPQVQKMLGIMRDTCRDSVNLIRDFVDGEFMDSASVELKRTRVDLVLALRQVVETYQQGEHLVAKHFHFEPAQATLFVEIDNNKFLQVINNLMSNAIKFTREGGHITVRVEQRAHTVLVTVADDGIGIPAALLPVLFDRFTKARRPGLRGEKTTGLGMHLIQTLVRLHNGTIWVESAENQGTTFYMELPSLAAPLAV
ncbi:sensor histidine kinase [Hymenobacter convexus]|uniref:sensor histidine kinase n=1 Tax=Hymenobacter sp. CA1UV-4 TaxID=3063782 RepID=UPI00271304A0|nr:ATP-binding protein [Hymenobacter sp. CA1UV-4]MDO7850266.1 ATP-binding protein [Hymenobacter sp. CA1UV-4]